MHEHFLLMTLSLADSRKGFCAPNPAVGAVIVHQGEVVAKANHYAAGKAHAEQKAIELFLEKKLIADDTTTLYVSLEPCNHWGKTPPCTDSIIHSGIKCVYFAYNDPNPIVANKNTKEILRAHGIECHYYPVSAVSRFYQSYHHWLIHKKPYITAKMAQSLDGKIAYKDGKRCFLSNPALNAFTHKQRKKTDVILTTARTVSHDNPYLNVRLGDEKPIAKNIAVIDADLSLSHDANIYHSAKELIIFYDEKHPLTAKNDKANYIPINRDNNGLALSPILAYLGERGFHDVWLEAGGKLFSIFLQQQLVNKAYLYVVPKFLGEKALPLYWGKERALLEEAHIQCHEYDKQWLYELDFKRL